MEEGTEKGWEKDEEGKGKCREWVGKGVEMNRAGMGKRCGRDGDKTG